MTKNINYVSHKKSKLKTNDGKPQLPSASALVEGEIAINYAENVETLSIKNESGTVVTFSSDNYYTKQKLGSAFTDNDVTVTNVTNSISGVANAAAVGVLSLKETKADLSAFTEHTASTVHMTETEKTNLDSLATNIGAISGITSNDIDAWNAAAGTDLTQYYKKTETSGKTELSTAFDLKANDADLDAVSGTVNTHITNTEIHVTVADKNDWNAKLDTDDIESFFGAVNYDKASKRINFYNETTGGTVLAYIDASDFVKDSFLESVTIENKTISGETVPCLVFKWDTESGKDETVIPISGIFDPSNYYNKSEIDGFISDLEAADSIISGAVNNKLSTTDFNAYSANVDTVINSKVDASTYNAYTASTATEIGNKLAVSDFDTYSGAVNTLIGEKASQDSVDTLNNTVTAHTANTDIHVTAADKTNWNSKSDFSGSYNDLTDKPTIPSKTSDLTNDSDFATSGYVQAVTSDMATETWVNGQGYLTSADIEDKQDVSGMTAYTTTATTNELSGTVTAHTANTEIHVTTEDKSKWNNVDNKLNTSDFNTYSGAVDTAISNKAEQSDLSILSGTVTGHTADSTIHVTSSDKSAWNAKVDSSDIANFFDDAKYEDSGTSKVINFYHGNTIKATIDADDFIKDGMISGVTLESKSGTTYLVINWNTNAGIETTELNIGDIFEADNYYTKSETSGKTEISTALGTKVNSATFTAHTADTSAHFSGDEKENLDSLAANIAAISGITSTNVNNWDTAATSAHNHSNKSTLDAITASSAAINSLTGTVGTMAFENVNSYSSATQVNTALSGKANSSDVYDKSETSGATELSTEFALYTKKADVDQVIDETTSASTRAVSTSAVYGFVTAYTPSITVDQVIDETTSASTNPVATKAVYSALTELNEVEVNNGDTPTSNSVELWVDESIDPVTVEVYTKSETNSLLDSKLNVSDFNTYSGAVDTTISSKSDKTSTVSNVSYDSESGKLQKTINGSTTDVVSIVNSGFRFEFSNGVLNLIPIGTATASVTNGVLNLTF